MGVTIEQLQREITERKRAEEALRESEEKHRTILETIEDSYYEVDIAGNFTFFNDSVCKLLGYPADELMGMNSREYMDDENARKVYQTFNAVYRTGEPARAFDWEVIRKDGTRRFVEASVSLIRDSTGEPAGFRGIVRDVTERKQVEQEIKRRNRELAALSAITSAIMQSALDLDEVLQRTADGIVEGLGCNTALILLLDEKEGVFKGKAVSTRGKTIERINAVIGSPLVQIQFPARSDSSEAVRNTLDGRITIKHDLYELVSPILSKPVCSVLQGLLGSRTFLSLPLLAKGKVVGGIFASTREELGEGGTETIMTFANQAAIAIENARLYERAQRSLEQLTALRQTALDITARLDTTSLLEAIVQRATELLKARGGGIYLYDSTRQELTVAVDYGLRRSVVGTTLKPGEGLAGRVAQTGEPMIVDDYRTWPGRSEKYAEGLFTAVVEVPLKWQGQVIGVLVIVDDVEERVFTEDDVQLLSLFADQAAVAIENAGLFKEIEERHVYLEGVLGAAPDAIVTLDTHHRIVEWNTGAERLFGYSREEAVGQSIDDLITSPDVFEEATGFTQTVMSGEEMPPTETVRYRKDGSPVDVIVAGSPILVGDELIGVVAVYTDITARKRMEETLRALALVDDLTALYNRRGFFTLAQQQLKTASRAKTSMMLLFADFDDLKEINDTFGHPEGDQALIEIADVLKKTFRESDIIARIGGDEFVVLAIETNGFPAELLTRRLQENLQARNAREGRHYKLSLSTGIARYDPEHPCSVDELLTRADRAMYQQRQSRQPTSDRH